MGNPKKAKAKAPVSSKKKGSKKKAGSQAAAAEHMAVDDGAEAGPSVPNVWRPGDKCEDNLPPQQRDGEHEATLLRHAQCGLEGAAGAGTCKDLAVHVGGGV